MQKFKLVLEMIQFKHTVFSVPFALAGAWMAASGIPDFKVLLLIIVGVVAARTMGMCINRLADLDFDKANPRTSGRPLASGRLPLKVPAVLAFFSFLVFIMCAWMLNPLCLKLAPIATVLIVVYSFLKRWTFLCHFGVGSVIGCAPLGGWVAVSEVIDPAALMLSAAVAFWVAGFDIIYSIQDTETDRSLSLYSIPACFGFNSAVNISALCHFFTASLLLALYFTYPFKGFYFFGSVSAAALLCFEHYLIRRDFEKHVNFAFFTVNGVMSIVFIGVICVSV